MREILFRGKAIEKHAGYEIGQWVYGNFIEGVGGKNDCYINPKGTVSNVKVNPDTVGQYTGMKDNNRKRIFEGDILKGRMSSIGKFKGVVISMMECMYGVKCRKGYIFNFYDIDNCFVIGNRYDNNDLLEWEIARYLTND